MGSRRFWIAPVGGGRQRASQAPPQRPSAIGDSPYYVYAILHHPTYRERYAENLKRELPRIPVEPSSLSTKSFSDFVEVGRVLADLHLNYETADEYPLQAEYTQEPFSWRVEKMKLSKDKTSLIVNETLTLKNIPPDTFRYRLGNRSALEWIID